MSGEEPYKSGCRAVKWRIMADQNERNPGNVVWYGIGLGILAGVAAGLLVAVKHSRDKHDPLAESVEELKSRAERVLNELSESVSEIIQQAHNHVDAPVTENVATHESLT